MTNLAKVVSSLNKYCCIHFAETWDNVGLLVNSNITKEISKILVTTDLTQDVLDEAIHYKADLIISYHPLIFKSLKCVETSNWKNRIVAKCLENSISVYSPHTGLDNKKQGLNDWLLSPFHFEICFSLTNAKKMESFHEFFLFISRKEFLDLFVIDEILSWKEIDNVVILCQVPGKNLEFFMKKISGIEHYCHEINTFDCLGSGRMISLESEIKLSTVIEIMKRHLDVDSLRITYGKDSSDETMIKRIAVCAGSGGSFSSNDLVNNADLYITGEASHHELLDFKHKGISVITAGHTSTERGFLKSVFTQWLQTTFSSVNVKFSSHDSEPFNVK